MAEILYTIAVTFTDDSLAQQWLHWLRQGHVAEVLAAGATAAEVVQLDGASLSIEVRYRFPSRAAFTSYEQDHAPRLRAEGLKHFPPEKGITYRRTLGEVRESFQKGTKSS